MSRLSKLYEAMETLQVLSKTIEPALQPVQRELVLVVDYVPGKSL